MANYYLNNIKNEKIILPTVLEEQGHVWHLFVLRTNERQQLQEYLTKQNVQTLIHYPIPPHKQKAYKNLNHLSFPITEKIHEEVISIPLSSSMTKEEIEKIFIVINKF